MPENNFVPEEDFERDSLDLIKNLGNIKKENLSKQFELNLYTKINDKQKKPTVTQLVLFSSWLRKLWIPLIISILTALKSAFISFCCLISGVSFVSLLLKGLKNL